jgi:hypothetical protein
MPHIHGSSLDSTAVRGLCTVLRQQRNHVATAYQGETMHQPRQQLAQHRRARVMHCRVGYVVTAERSCVMTQVTAHRAQPWQQPGQHRRARVMHCFMEATLETQHGGCT